MQRTNKSRVAKALYGELNGRNALPRYISRSDAQDIGGGNEEKVWGPELGAEMAASPGQAESVA